MTAPCPWFCITILYDILTSCVDMLMLSLVAMEAANNPDRTRTRTSHLLKIDENTFCVFVSHWAPD